MSEQPGRAETNRISQPYYAFQDGRWQERSSCPQLPRLPSPIKLFTWNIDFRMPNKNERMQAAIQYLSFLLDDTPPETPVIIFFQEMIPGDLHIIKAVLWIRTRFHITDRDPRYWRSRYGTTTLIDHRLPIAEVFRMRYRSDMGRDGLFVDIRDEVMVVRFCNTHLESLRAVPPLRPSQVQLASQQLHSPNVDAGLMAGDFNAIEDFDRTLHIEHGLKDAYLENGGVEGHEESWTWGMQSGHWGRRYGFSRMDKMLFCGKIQVTNLERIGAGLKIVSGDEGEDSGQFVTDHLGLMADLHLEQGSRN